MYSGMDAVGFVMLALVVLVLFLALDLLVAGGGMTGGMMGGMAGMMGNPVGQGLMLLLVVVVVLAVAGPGLLAGGRPF